jgi:hypothetical protein
MYRQVQCMHVWGRDGKEEWEGNVFIGMMTERLSDEEDACLPAEGLCVMYLNSLQM